MSTCQKHDSQVLGELLDSADLDAAKVVIGDGAYGMRTSYHAAKRRGLRLVSPPHCNARPRTEPELAERNLAIDEIRLLGQKGWQLATRYHRRSLAESAMHRLKAAFGPALRSRKWTNQVHEALLRAHILN